MQKFKQRLENLERGKPCETWQIKIEYVEPWPPSPESKVTPGPVFVYSGTELIKVIPGELGPASNDIKKLTGEMQ